MVRRVTFTLQNVCEVHFYLCSLARCQRKRRRSRRGFVAVRHCAEKRTGCDGEFADFKGVHSHSEKIHSERPVNIFFFILTSLVSERSTISMLDCRPYHHQLVSHSVQRFWPISSIFLRLLLLRKADFCCCCCMCQYCHPDTDESCCGASNARSREGSRVDAGSRGTKCGRV